MNIFSATIGPIYTSPPGFTYDTVFNDTNKYTPVIFVLSPGVDPYHQLEQFSKAKSCNLIPVSLG